MKVLRDTPDFQDWERELEGFSDRLDKLIRESGKTQRQIARDMRLTECMLSVWKNGGAKQMSAFNVWRLSRYFRVSVDWLLTGRYAVSKRRPLPPVREYQTLGGAKRDTSDTRDERRPGSLPLG
jgi:transcriptional regulator with XRE-family HTH domain